MPTKHSLLILYVLIFASFSLIAPDTRGQASPAPSLVTQSVDATKVAALRGNTHPLARSEFDRGAAPASLPINHMLLTLKRSAEQSAALETLLAQQQDRSSPNYHKWLSPDQFGRQFGPSDQDIQAVTAWLRSQGFQDVHVSNGRTTIDFSGTAGSVQAAFRTAIHKYVLSSGEEHWANASDPEIPVALTPVVAGINSLNDFPRKPMNRVSGVLKRSMTTGKVTAVKPQFTFAGNCYGNGTNCYALGPADLAKIYSLPSTQTGAGETIAIMSDSDVYDSDVTSFRSLFGLPAITLNRIIPTGTSNPGVQFCSANQDEEEAVLDVEWAGAAAPGATIDLVISGSAASDNCSAPTNPTFTFGGDYSAQYIVDCQPSSTTCPSGTTPAPAVQVLSYSYGECELALGSMNTFYQNSWSQAAAEGITVVVATGDNGSAGCDADVSGDGPVQPALYGLAVNGVASTPYDVAVGGTDFNYPNFTTGPNQYWTTNGTGELSAAGYIPEMAYNDTCTNQDVYTNENGFFFAGGGYTTAEAACNSATVQDAFSSTAVYVAVGGGGGGVSDCTTPGGPSPSNCSGGYAKPIWQVGIGVPSDGKRDIPDVSLFSGDGYVSATAYVVCESDLAASISGTTPASCSLTYPAGTESGGEPYADFVEEGGTSVATQVFAGIVALIDQKQGGAQGNINPMLYSLAGEQSVGVFNDIAVGTNAMPCATTGTPPNLTLSPNCTVTGSSSNTIGILSGYNTTIGYDLVTGLGSMNVSKLVSNSGANFYLSSSSPTVTVSSPGASGTMSITVNSVNGYSGAVALACSGLPTGATCTFSPASPITLTATGSGASQSVTVTVNTTSASIVGPTKRPSGPNLGIKSTEITVAFVLTLGMIWLGVVGEKRRWNTAVAVALFTMLILIGACGGGSTTTTTGTGTTTTTGTTGNTTATLTGTGSSGSPADSLNFTVTIQ